MHRSHLANLLLPHGSASQRLRHRVLQYRERWTSRTGRLVVALSVPRPWHLHGSCSSSHVVLLLHQSFFLEESPVDCSLIRSTLGLLSIVQTSLGNQPRFERRWLASKGSPSPRALISPYNQYLSRPVKMSLFSKLDFQWRH